MTIAMPVFVGLICLTANLAIGDPTTLPASPTSQPLLPVKELRVPLATVVPEVTAAADDPAWADGVQIDHLTLPADSQLADDEPLPTQIALRWDADWLYIRFTSTGAVPYSPFGDRRDAPHYLGDVVEVFLDPTGDGRQFFELQLSPANGLFDQNILLTTDAVSDAEGLLVNRILSRDYWPNTGYNMKDLRTASLVSGEGPTSIWIADFAIPAKAALRRIGKTQFEKGLSLRVNLLRYRWTAPRQDTSRRLLAMNWSPVVFGCPHISPAAMGMLTLVNE
jgi:hypothetical protein